MYPKIFEQFPVIYAPEKLGCNTTGILSYLEVFLVATASFKYLNIQKLENIIIYRFLIPCPPSAPPTTPLMAKMRY